MRIKEYSKMKSSHRTASLILGVVHVVFGIAVLIGGSIRFPPPTYQPLLNFTNGEVWPYGLVFLIAGVLTLFHKTIPIMVGLLLSAVIDNFWSALFLVAIFSSPNSGITPSVAFGGYALCDCVLLVLIATNRENPNGAKKSGG